MVGARHHDHRMGLRPRPVEAPAAAAHARRSRRARPTRRRRRAACRSAARHRLHRRACRPAPRATPARRDRPVARHARLHIGAEGEADQRQSLARAAPRAAQCTAQAGRRSRPRRHRACRRCARPRGSWAAPPASRHRTGRAPAAAAPCAAPCRRAAAAGGPRSPGRRRAAFGRSNSTSIAPAGPSSSWAPLSRSSSTLGISPRTGRPP